LILNPAIAATTKSVTTMHFPENDPRYHAANIKRMLDDTAQHAREDVEKGGQLFTSGTTGLSGTGPPPN
jgi:hypothetical protein